MSKKVNTNKSNSMPLVKHICPIKRCRSCINLDKCDPPKSLRNTLQPLWWCTVIQRYCEDAITICIDNAKKGFDYWRHK